MSDPLATTAGHPSTMTVRRAGEGISAGPEGVARDPFRVQILLSSLTDGEMTAMRAFLPPGVVPHWHAHPRGQLLFVLDGIGLVRREGGAVIEVRAGDSVWFAPDERHWHGASPSSPFSYLSVQPVQGGTAVRWMEPVEPERVTT
ncbi:cupin domain-containing protein [Methylobacterium pseudosasicola]|uniref:Cupin domain protein n=1 Tax=Methylobacterium pseudosasicola TaxID=582667 RepID=A0A1I4F747_9HYPH|nr:cupin domain-containing protein [Methylobacterium pseudosasicola]SFL13110.1 Cupin domain protein [Methylobacterium pseudosasicola]